MKTTLLAIALIFATATYASDDQTTGTATSAVTGNIVLSNFKGSFSDELEVTLSWATMMEKEVDHFEILRSGDGFNFQVIDSIRSKMKISTNSYQLEYNYSDSRPLTGVSYYRVKVIGKNGYMNQSPVVQINNSVISGTRIYPTIVQNNFVFVETDKLLREAKLEFFDLSGNKVSETAWDSLNGRQNVQVSKSGNLPTGTYVARLSSNGQNVKSQMVIIKGR